MWRKVNKIMGMKVHTVGGGDNRVKRAFDFRFHQFQKEEDLKK